MNLGKGIMLEFILKITGALLMLIFTLLSIYAVFCVHRWMNWELYYEDKVIETVERECAR
jgi:hypothetical protein